MGTDAPRFVDVDGLRIAYRQGGRGPPLVLLHGILADGRVWASQLADLASEFTVIACDAPGTGESADPAEHFTMSDYAARSPRSWMHSPWSRHTFSACRAAGCWHSSSTAGIRAG